MQKQSSMESLNYNGSSVPKIHERAKGEYDGVKTQILQKSRRSKEPHKYHFHEPREDHSGSTILSRRSGHYEPREDHSGSTILSRRSGHHELRKDQKQKLTKENMSTSLEGSMTVEASLVMGLILIAIVHVCLFAFRMHDVVLGNILLNEGIERCSHLPEDETGQDLTDMENHLMESFLSHRGFEMELERSEEECEGMLRAEDYEKDMSMSVVGPEVWMRRLTLVEEIID